MADIVYKPAYSGESKQYPSLQPTKRDLNTLCLFYGTRKCIGNAAVDDDESKVAYTVPEAKVFLIVSATISMANNDTVRRTSWLVISPSNQAFDIQADTNVLCNVSTNQTSSNSTSVSFPIPIIMQAGERIGIFNEDTDSTTSGSVTGYEIDSSIFYSLL